jgi:hypothetical protein
MFKRDKTFFLWFRKPHVCLTAMFFEDREMAPNKGGINYLTPVTIAIIKNTTNNRCWTPHTLLVGMQASATTLEKNMVAS